jgi:hypothetical protein
MPKPFSMDDFNGNMMDDDGNILAKSWINGF